MGQLHTGQVGHDRRGDVLPRPVAGRGIGHLVRIGAREFDQVLERGLRQVLACDQGVRILDRQAHRHEVLLRVVGKLGVKPRVERDVRQRPQQQRVAVGRRLGHRLGADQGAGAGAVLDHHRLTQQRAELVGNLSRDAVEAAAGRLRHDEFQRPVRKVLGARRRGQRRQHGHATQRQNPHEVLEHASIRGLKAARRQV